MIKPTAWLLCFLCAPHSLLCAQDIEKTSQPLEQSGFLLKAPPLISAEAVEAKTATLPLNMTWRKNLPEPERAWVLSFDYQQGETILKLQFIGGLPNDLSPEEKTQFTKTEEHEEEAWTYSHGGKPCVPEKKTPTPSPEENMGMVGEPLTGKGTPSTLAVRELAQNLQGKQTVFYTGAGISNGIVPTMPQIMSKLGLRPSLNILDLTKTILANANLFKEPMHNFYESCLNGKPTLAHNALKEIVLLKNWGLLTENLDLLHQRSGIDPLNHGMKNWLKSTTSEHDLKQIDVVITIGLQSDESGFLRWYKTTNPKGTIVAINLQQPTYVGEGDFILLGDAQTILPDLLKELSL